MGDERLNNLEIQIAHQSDMIDELNETIVKQWHEIDLLKKRLKQTNMRVEQVEDAMPDNKNQEQPPPHY